MSLSNLLEQVSDKSHFVDLQDYIDFAHRYLGFIDGGVQAIIISQNENHYQFYQYKNDGNYNITRPINSLLMYDVSQFSMVVPEFLALLDSVKEIKFDDVKNRNIIIRFIYTIQQTIGLSLDALPAGVSNKARKINGDLFERLIQILIRQIGIYCVSGTMQVPVYLDNEIQMKMRYQHDLLIYNENEIKIIGSVKTSSKDRIDKIFMDKFLYSRLTETQIPHIAIFLNDVQRKNSRDRRRYGVNSTFLSGHFKAFTVKLNALDGVYYCDIRPNMQTDEILNKYIYTIDKLFCTDIWELMGRSGLPLETTAIDPEEIF